MLGNRQSGVNGEHFIDIKSSKKCDVSVNETFFTLCLQLFSCIPQKFRQSLHMAAVLFSFEKVFSKYRGFWVFLWSFKFKNRYWKPKVAIHIKIEVWDWCFASCRMALEILKIHPSSVEMHFVQDSHKNLEDMHYSCRILQDLTKDHQSWKILAY